jgi:hypothetical protein
MDEKDARIAELEDKLKEAERRLAETRIELDEAQDLTKRMEEHLKDAAGMIERWKESFEMELGDDGGWHFPPDHLSIRHAVLIEMHNALVKEWNRLVPDYNAAINPKPVGRPIAASDAQVKTVHKLRQRGLSIRAIVEETSLGMQTVRTIIDRDDKVDRATSRRLERLNAKELRAELMSARARKRTRDALPKAIEQTLAGGAALIKESKGLGRR